MNDAKFWEEDPWGDEEKSESDDGGEEDSRKRKRSKQKRVTLATCAVCKPAKLFSTFECYTAHIRSHIVEELYLTAPCRAAVADKCRRSYKDIISAIIRKSEEYTSGRPKEVLPLLRNLLSRDNLELVRVVAYYLWTMCVPPPTTFRQSTFKSSYLVSLNKQLNKNFVRANLIKCLKANEIHPGISDDAVQWFMVQFTRRMAREVEVFYLKCMREPQEMLFYEGGWTKELDNCNMQQTVYYVCGSVIRNILSHAMRSKSNPQWNAVDTFIRKHVLVGELVSVPEGSIAEWTRSQDVGRLKFIGESMYVFLMGLVSIVHVLRRDDDSSILHDKLFTSVKGDPGVMYLWSEVVKQFLSAEHSDFLLFQICHFLLTPGIEEGEQFSGAVADAEHAKGSLVYCFGFAVLTLFKSVAFVHVVNIFIFFVTSLIIIFFIFFVN